MHDEPWQIGILERLQHVHETLGCHWQWRRETKLAFVRSNGICGYDRLDKAPAQIAVGLSDYLLG